MFVYMLVALTPLVIARTANPPPGRDFWLEFAVALGFIGLSIMGLQFAIVSRFSSVNAPFGLDVALRFHTFIAFVALAFVLAHPTIIVLGQTETLDLLNPFTGTWAARFGLASVAALGILIVTSVWRKPLHIGYEWWRVLHGVLAVAIIAFALAHIWSVGYYVDGPWKQGLWILSSAVLIALLVNVRLVKPLRMLRRPWRVASVSPLRGDAWRLTIEPVGHDGLRFLPGQFAWLTIGRSPFAIREHPFSFSSSADRRDHLTFTIKEAGDFTSELGSLEPGTTVYLDGPYGVFSYERNEGPRFVFVAGGVGIAPIMSMLRTLADRGDPRPCLVIFGNPTWDDAVMREELAELAARLDLEVVHVLEDPPPDWDGESGFIDAHVLARHLGDDASRARYFICGPGPMMDAVHDALLVNGIPLEQIDLERFDLV